MTRAAFLRMLELAAQNLSEAARQLDGFDAERQKR